MLVHFKNDLIKGPQKVPIAVQLLEPLVLQHKAHKAYAMECPSLFFSRSFTIMAGPYFSTICGDILTPKGCARVTANTYRHMVSTMWRDYINDPHTKVLGISVEELDEAATSMMLSSSNAVDHAYDDTTRARSYSRVMDHWPKFKSFVLNNHQDFKSRRWVALNAMCVGCSMRFSPPRNFMHL